MEILGLLVNWHKTLDKHEHLTTASYLSFLPRSVVEIGCMCLTYDDDEDDDDDRDDDNDECNNNNDTTLFLIWMCFIFHECVHTTIGSLQQEFIKLCDR